MRVAEIHRYPVKSMQGERLMQALLTEQGIPGDRAWALRDEAGGGLTGAKKLPGLMSMGARLVREPSPTERSPEVQITTSAEVLSSASGDIDAALSRALDHPVSLWPLLPADRDDHYRRAPLPAGTDPVARLRAALGRTEDEPLPDLSGLPAALATYQTPPGTYFDAYPLLIMTRASITALAQQAAAGGIEANFDLRRFRPNVLVDTDEAGFVENRWVGRELAVGGALIRIEMACPRCIMTTHGFDSVPRDPRIMRALVRHNGGNLGVYASVLRSGPVRTGDAIELH